MALPIERLLQLSAITPLVELRNYLAKNPDVSAEEAVVTLVTINETFLASDHEAALVLHKMLHPRLSFAAFEADLRAALSQVLVEMRPQWAKRVFLGRARFLSDVEKIDTEVRRCFRTAGLFEGNPEDDVVYWWDRLCHDIRGIQNFENFMQGRSAEQRSLAVERKRLAHLGIDAEPKWQAIEDNTLGYDILSYRSHGSFPTNLLIEVKSSSRNPPVIVISRNEWKKAKEAKENYVFHVWHVRPDSSTLFEWTFEMISGHMPTDQGKGQWTNVEVPLGAVKTPPAQLKW